ncbi:hypothetical protein DSM104635_00370 [Terricaulis silvestris]|uniref:Uncharacterized protein n=1 Tax=Terricaulis silvestris TaxID=2686094 RepID=A0A6I6MK35_9CAUL|nr:hypothetical protein DSM104635_00370 [Terricaulis silvestris]
MTQTSLHRFVRLAYLAPDLIREILDGRQRPGLTLDQLCRADLPLDWSAQRRLFSARGASSSRTQSSANRKPRRAKPTCFSCGRRQRPRSSPKSTHYPAAETARTEKTRDIAGAYTTWTSLSGKGDDWVAVWAVRSEPVSGPKPV